MPLRALLLILSLTCAASVMADEWSRFRAPKPVSIERGSSRMTLHSMSQNDTSLEVKVTISTPSMQRTAWEETELKDARLTAFISQTVKESHISSANFSSRMRLTERGTPLGIDTITLTYPVGRKDWDLKAAELLELKFGDGIGLGLDMKTAEAFTPFSWKDFAGPIQLDVEVRASRTAAAVFPMRLISMKVLNGRELELTVSFENAHRAKVRWHSGMTGSLFRMVTQEDTMIMPVAISESLRSSILPDGIYFDSGFTNQGTVRFPLLAEDEAQQFTITFPNYRPTTLRFDAQAKTWKPIKDTTQNKEWTQVDATLDKELSFTGLRKFLLDTGKLATSGDQEAFIKRFSGKISDEAESFVRGLKKTSVTDLRWELSPRFEVVLDDDATKPMDMEMGYRIEGLGAENEFGLDAKIRVRRTGKSSWQITQLTYPLQTPFWQCGYTSVTKTDHFAVFHWPDRDGEKQATTTGKDLEKAYAALREQGLPLRDRYAAFAITRPEDFKKLTSRNPGTFSGVASARQVFRDDKLININQAIFINDPRFSFLERLMRRHDHQQTVQHELAHLAFANSSRPWTPAWLEEGIAMHFAQQIGRDEQTELGQLLTSGLNLRNLSVIPYLGYRSDELPLATGVQYLMSGATVKWLAAKFGTAAVIKFHRSFADDHNEEWRRLSGKTDSDRVALKRLEITRDAVEKHFNMKLEALDAAVKSSL